LKWSAGYGIEYWFADTVSGSAHAAQRSQFKDLLDKIRRKDTLMVLAAPGQLFVLVDVNNMYVSCERAFNPKLQNRPVVVLSK
jgi:hypothetical protein